MKADTIRESMIVKHFYRHKWELNNNWENVDHVFGAPDADSFIEDNERAIAQSMEISDDEEDEMYALDRGFTQRRLRQSQRRAESPGRKRAAATAALDDDLINDLSPENSTRPSQHPRLH
jgi:hypothetical protein